MLKDIRQGLRNLYKHSTFTAVCVVTLALGIGINTGIFTLLYSLAFRPLPVKDPHGLVAMVLFDSAGDYARQKISFPLYREYAAETEAAFSELLGLSALVGESLGVSARSLADGGSWAHVAEVAGVTRQAAWSRWRSENP